MAHLPEFPHFSKNPIITNLGFNWTSFLQNDKDRSDRNTSASERGQRMESSQSSPGNIGMAATRSMGVLPDLVQQHASNTSGHQSSPQHRLQDSTTSDEVRDLGEFFCSFLTCGNENEF